MIYGEGERTSARSPHRWNASRVPDMPSMDTTANASLRRACLTLLDQNLADPRLSQSWLAGELHVSRRHLSRSFEGHRSTTTAIALARLTAAVAVMRSLPSLPLTDVAEMCGYSAYETLRSQARRHYDRTPRQLAELVRSARHATTGEPHPTSEY